VVSATALIVAADSVCLAPVCAAVTR
jgi:hypothetical protein